MDSFVLAKTVEWRSLIKRQLIHEDNSKRLYLGSRPTRFSCSTGRLLYLIVLCTGSEEIDATEVMYSTDSRGSQMKRESKTKTVTVFTDVVTSWKAEGNIRFYITFSNFIKNFPLECIESRMEDQWAAATNRQFTDIEFLVGDEVYPAHKAIVAARSSVFAAMFKSGVVDARAGKVNIIDVDPKVFELFLRYIYTGHWKPSEKDPQLLAVAEKYQVESLRQLCSSSIRKTVELDMDEFLNIMADMIEFRAQYG